MSAFGKKLSGPEPSRTSIASEESEAPTIERDPGVGCSMMRKNLSAALPFKRLCKDSRPETKEELR